MTDGDEDCVPNPFFKFGVARDGGRECFRVESLRRGVGWQVFVVSEDVNPRLFSLLQTLYRAPSAIELDLSDEDYEALRGIGFLVSAEELAESASFCVPLDDGDHARSDEDAHAGARASDDAGLSVHPTLAHDPPASIAWPCDNVAPGSVVWLDDSGRGAFLPYWSRSLTPALARCSAGMPAPPFETSARRQLRRAHVLVTRDELEARQAVRASSFAEAANAFARVGYAVVPSMLPLPYCTALRSYFRKLIAEGHVPFGDDQVERRFARHNDPVARLVLEAMTGVVNAVSPVRVKPAYVYFAAYREGAVLKRHRDRPQCDTSVSLLIDYEPCEGGAAPWPLWVARGEESAGEPVFQRVTDGIIYRGCELDHWRAALPQGHSSMHLFLHYVPADFAGTLD